MKPSELMFPVWLVWLFCCLQDVFGFTIPDYAAWALESNPFIPFNRERPITFFVRPSISSPMQFPECPGGRVERLGNQFICCYPTDVTTCRRVNTRRFPNLMNKKEICNCPPTGPPPPPHPPIGKPSLPGDLLPGGPIPSPGGPLPSPGGPLPSPEGPLPSPGGPQPGGPSPQPGGPSPLPGGPSPLPGGPSPLPGGSNGLNGPPGNENVDTLRGPSTLPVGSQTTRGHGSEPTRGTDGHSVTTRLGEPSTSHQTQADALAGQGSTSTCNCPKTTANTQRDVGKCSGKTILCDNLTYCCTGQGDEAVCRPM